MFRHSKGDVGEVIVVSSNYVPNQRKTWTAKVPNDQFVATQTQTNNSSDSSLLKRNEETISSTSGFENLLKSNAWESIVEKPDHSTEEELLRRENATLKRELESYKLKLSCQKEENLALSASLFSIQEEVKKMRSIIKKKDNELKQQQEKLEAILSNSDTRLFKVMPKSPQESIMKREVESLRNRLKNTEEKVEGLKATKKELEKHIEMLSSQLQNERITNSYLQEQAKQTITQMAEERDKTETFKDYYNYYTQNRDNLEHGDLEEQFEQLILAKQELESKLFKREEQLFDLTMKYEALRTEHVLNCTTNNK
ncbi:hypothetical protein FDP41_006789 [Naegleria fowleri]|uniref:Uncharacterized protein n=1 Tax=Naegleria fowleri TaxID=5763 RepID=A0A6A5BMP1_NAEFO|nr:uncharacterized protein FDP41_006789 [Naegleria fowleri]KAF0974179.1 hypothetical protein FDP41_006789 [Naegleria fowleri]